MTLAHESFLFLRQLAEQGAVPFHTLTAEQARAMFSRLREVAGDGRTSPPRRKQCIRETCVLIS